MTLLKRPKFVNYKDGHIQELFCKVCGVPIAGERDTVRARRQGTKGETIEEHVHKFQRFRNYTEVKLEFEDGSFHVTNGCGSCLGPNMSSDTLQAMYEADMEDSPQAFSSRDKGRKVKRVASISYDFGGLS